MTQTFLMSFWIAILGRTWKGKKKVPWGANESKTKSFNITKLITKLRLTIQQVQEMCVVCLKTTRCAV